MDNSTLVPGRGNIDKLRGLSRYGIDVHDCPHFLDVLDFRAEEKLSEPGYYAVTVTCAVDDIAGDMLLLKPASFTFLAPQGNGMPAVPIRTVFGVVHAFQRLRASVDETRYTLTIVPRIALLQHTKRSEIYLNQTVPEVVESLLRSHGLSGVDFEFRLSQPYPVRELVTQWHETDLAFVQRLLAEVGIFWCFEMDTRLEQDVVIFQDSPRQYGFGMALPLIAPSHTNDNGQFSVWDIHTHHRVVTGLVTTRDDNARQGRISQDSIASIPVDDGITAGEAYRYYADPPQNQDDTESAENNAFYARLHHERILNGRQVIVGKTTSPRLMPGNVLEPLGILPANLKKGIVITGVKSGGSRSRGFRMAFTGIPYRESVCYRPPLRRRPVIAGTLPARVESAEKGDIYPWLDNQGRYRVKLDFDRSHGERGYAYLWLRMAKPYAGNGYGFHSPLLDGTEVSVMFDGGDPDRPYIAHAQHDAGHPDHVTRDNHTRNVWRTPANNKLRLEDRRQAEHIKLATEYGKTQLNIGHLVNSERKRRGV
nr:type VI secretion system tip protein VgrG [Martelella alba]